MLPTFVDFKDVVTLHDEAEVLHAGVLDVGVVQRQVVRRAVVRYRYILLHLNLALFRSELKSQTRQIQ